jgi:hypothetical protein
MLRNMEKTRSSTWPYEGESSARNGSVHSSESSLDLISVPLEAAKFHRHRYDILIEMVVFLS